MPSARSRIGGEVVGQDAVTQRREALAERPPRPPDSTSDGSISGVRPRRARGHLDRDLPVDHDLTRRVALAPLAPRVATHDVDRDPVRCAALQRGGEHDRHPGRARHEDGDAERLVEHAREHTAVDTPGEPACCGPKVHRARTSTGVGGDPGGGSFGRSTHSMGGACGLSRPDPAWVRLSTRPSAWRARNSSSASRAAPSISVRRRSSAAASAARPGVDVGHDHRFDGSRVAATRSNASAGICAGSGRESPGSPATPRRKPVGSSGRRYTGAGSVRGWRCRPTSVRSSTTSSSVKGPAGTTVGSGSATCTTIGWSRPPSTATRPRWSTRRRTVRSRLAARRPAADRCNGDAAAAAPGNRRHARRPRRPLVSPGDRSTT